MVRLLITQGLSLGIIFIKNELNQSLLHLASIYGSLKCISYLIFFNLLSPNELDHNKGSALYYAITQLKTYEDKNKAIVALLLNITDLTVCSHDDVDMKELMNDWQKNLLTSYKDLKQQID